MQAYILLCPELYLQKYGKELMQVCQYLIKDIRTEGIVMICRLYITMLKTHSEYAVELLHPVMIDIMTNLLGDSDYLSIKQMYLQVVTRFFFANQNALSQVLDEVKIENSFQKLLTIWFNTMPGVTQNEDKKLLAIGLCRLLTVPNDFIMENFSVIIINVYETLCDIMKSDSVEGEEVDSLILTDTSEFESNGMYVIEDYEFKTPHYDRFRVICMRDPVHITVLKEYLQSQVSSNLAIIILLLHKFSSFYSYWRLKQWWATNDM